MHKSQEMGCIHACDTGTSCSMEGYSVAMIVLLIMLLRIHLSDV